MYKYENISGDSYVSRNIPSHIKGGGERCMSKKDLSEPECITFELQFTIAINMV